MKIERLLVYIMFLIVLIYSCKTTANHDLKIIYGDNIIHHFEHENNRNLSDEGFRLFESKEFEKAKRTFKKIECVGIGCRFKNISIADCYAALGDLENAKKYLFKSFEQGHDIRYLDTLLHKDNMPLLYEKLDYLKKSYESTINIEERNEILSMIYNDQEARASRNDNYIKNIDSINIEKLDSLTVNNWVSRERIGYLQNGKHPNVLVIHSDKEHNINYLNLMELSCLNGHDNWLFLENIISNLLFRFTFNTDDYLYVKRIYFDSNGEILYNKSSFMLASITKALLNNPSFSLKVKSGKGINSNMVETKLNSLKVALMEKGVPENQIVLDYSVDKNNSENGNDAIMLFKVF